MFEEPNMDTFDILPFGKHKGKTFEAVMTTDPKYCHAFKAWAGMVVAEYLGLRGWIPTSCATGIRVLNGSYGEPDIGKSIQVKWLPGKHSQLPIKKEDNPDHFYVLVTGDPAIMLTIHGWMAGREAQAHDEWCYALKDRSETFFVPQNALHDFDELKRKGLDFLMKGTPRERL
jgi:hypothetical protein